MAGLILGIDMHRRRRTYCQRPHEDSPLHGTFSLNRSRLQPTPNTTNAADAAATMDEAALIARRRLGEKLGYVFLSRTNRVQESESRGGRIRTAMIARDGEDHHLVSRILGRSWNFQANANKSKGQVCVVCLENFGAEQQVMELPCSHKFHSNCLLPWLAAHPNCPSCRNPVQP
ncbi:hypothetical protein U1Q18_031284 [Sarracenia purpurea var. burkii]